MFYLIYLHGSYKTPGGKPDKMLLDLRREKPIPVNQPLPNVS